MGAPKGNNFAIGNSGNNKFWETPEALQKDIDEYFEWCDKQKKKVYSKQQQDIIDMVYQVPYTIEGLCEVLDCDRATLLNYEKKEGYEVYFNTVKKAKLKIQRNKLERGLMGDSNATITLFDLTNNHEYINQKYTDVTTKGESINDFSGKSTEELIKRAGAIKDINEQS